MGSEYTDELDHVNTLKLLNRKLPGFMRVKWTERAGEIIEGGSRPKFLHFLQFVKRRATLVNNEFGEDLVTFSSDKGGKPKNRDYQGRFGQQTGSSFAARVRATKKGSKTIPYQLRQNVRCVPVNTEFGDVISFEVYLIRIKGDWCKQEFFVSSVCVMAILRSSVLKLSLNVKYKDVIRNIIRYCIPTN